MTTEIVSNMRKPPWHSLYRPKSVVFVLAGQHQYPNFSPISGLVASLDFYTKSLFIKSHASSVNRRKDCDVHHRLHNIGNCPSFGANRGRLSYYGAYSILLREFMVSSGSCCAILKRCKHAVSANRLRSRLESNVLLAI